MALMAFQIMALSFVPQEYQEYARMVKIVMLLSVSGAYEKTLIAKIAVVGPIGTAINGFWVNAIIELSFLLSAIGLMG